jgi:hypothetical protein
MARKYIQWLSSESSGSITDTLFKDWLRNYQPLHPAFNFLVTLLKYMNVPVLLDE